MCWFKFCASFSWRGQTLEKTETVRANRPILIPSVPVQRELKFGMVVSFSGAWYVPLPSCLEVWVGFCLANLVLIYLG